MQLVQRVIFAVLLVYQLKFSSCDSDVVDLHMCMKNRTVAIQVSSVQGDDSRCQCLFSPVVDQAIRIDYTHTPGIGSHKFHAEAKKWNEARKICNEENAHLAIINSQAEADVLWNIFRREQSKVHGTHIKEQAFLGIHDMFNEGEWLTIFGESIYSTGFVGWSSRTDCWNLQPDNYNGKQNCGSLILLRVEGSLYLNPGGQ